MKSRSPRGIRGPVNSLLDSFTLFDGGQSDLRATGGVYSIAVPLLSTSTISIGGFASEGPGNSTHHHAAIAQVGEDMVEKRTTWRVVPWSRVQVFQREQRAGARR